MNPTYYYGFADTLLEVVLHEPGGGRVPEALVQDIWQNQHVDARRLETVDGTPLTVLHPGSINTDAGPDFTGARIRIGGTVWNGAVEIHVRSGVWLEHGHDADPRYDGTILHVVLYRDLWTGKLRRSDGSTLPEVVLFPFLEHSLRRLIHSFYIRTDERILCSAGWHRVRPDVRSAYLRTLAAERMREKARRFAGRDPEQALFEGILEGLGYSKNAGAMHTLARSVPLHVCRQLADGADVEALMLGVSGLLPGPAELLDTDRETADYVMDLRDRYERLAHRFDVFEMPATSWRFFRLRPANFPPLRIAQAAALVGPRGVLHRDPYRRIEEAARSEKPLAALRSLFDVRLPEFWERHVRLEKRTRPRRASIGRQRVDALLVNVVMPALVARAGEDESVVERIIRLLDDVPAVSDEVVRAYAALGTDPASALEVQGLHQLYRTRCSEARCLSCRIGHDVLGAEHDVDAAGRSA